MLTIERHGRNLCFDDGGFTSLPYVYRPLTKGKFYVELFLRHIRSLGRVGQYVDVGAHLAHTV